MTQKERLIELLEKSVPQLDGICVDLDDIADYLLDNGVRKVVLCADCEYLEVRGMSGRCEKDIMGLVLPRDYCSRGNRKEKTK